MTHHWRHTSFKQLDGLTKSAPDDWTLYDDTGSPLERIYHHKFKPQAGCWSWTVLVAPDGTPFNCGTGTAATGKEAR
jgi:hypothetical protein